MVSGLSVRTTTMGMNSDDLCTVFNVTHVTTVEVT